MAPVGPPFESGFGPRTPPGDNLVNDFQQETARSFAAIAEARGDRCQRLAGHLTTTDAAMALPFWNRAVLEQPISDLGATLTALRDFYGEHGGGGPYLFDSAWPTPDLRPHGYALMGHPPMMMRAAGRPLPEAREPLRIVPVEDDATATDLERTLVDGYPAPMFQPFSGIKMFTPGALRAPGWRSFVGYDGDRPVAAGSSYVGDQLLRVENIAVLPDARGHGYGAAITAATIAVDLTRPAVLVASDLGRPIYEQLGFRAVTRVSYWLGRLG